MLQILNRDQEITTSALQTFHNGFTGGSEEILFYITNNHAEYYYQDITLEVVMVDLIEGDIFSESGWSIKIVQQSEQPTEKEWGEIFVNNKKAISKSFRNLLESNSSSLKVAFIFCVFLYHCPKN